MSTPTRVRLVVIALLLCVWAISLYRLTVFPPVHEDEPWIASTGWQIATRGVFGSPIFAGLWHMDERYYDFMPLYPLVSAVLFRLAGVDLFQARFVSVMLGLLTLALTFRVGQRLWNARMGLFAALALVLLPLTIPPDSTGSFFLDITRVARYDILVPVCGLTALLFFLRATKTKPAGNYALAGLFAGLAGLAHLYGAFWFVALAALAILRHRKGQPLVALLLGFLAPWSLYAAYVVSGWDAFRAQTQWYGNRFDLLDSTWYANNVVQELNRYQFTNSLAATLSVLLFAVGLIALIFAIRRPPAQTILLLLVIFAGGLAFFVDTKVAYYMILLAPIIALTLAFLLETIAGHLNLSVVRPIYLTAIISLASLLLVTRALALESAAAQTTPYQNLVAELRTQISPSSRVLGLHAFWFGLQDTDMHDWIVPLQWTSTRAGAPRMTMTQALDRLAPDTLIIDPRMGDYFKAAGTDTRPAQITAWLHANAFQCALQFYNPTYGSYQVYRRTNQAPGQVPQPCPTR